MHTFIAENNSQKIWATSIILEKMPKENNCPIGEHSPNLVTLVGTQNEMKIYGGKRNKKSLFFQDNRVF
jgi:hypothetical protein